MFEDKQQNSKEGIKEERIDIKVGKIKKDSKLILWLMKYKKAFILFEMIIFFVSSYIFFIGPEVMKVITSKQILSSKEQALVEAQSFKLKVEELQRERDGILSQDNQYAKKLYEVLPQKQNLPEIMAQVDALVRDYGLVLGSVQIQGTQEDSSDGEIPNNEAPIGDIIKIVQVTAFVLGGDGSYEKVKLLLDGLETHIRLFDITSFSFDPEMTTYSIVFKTYYLD